MLAPQLSCTAINAFRAAREDLVSGVPALAPVLGNSTIGAAKAA